jgi:hypothetical protein
MIVREDDKDEYVLIEDIEYFKMSEKFVDILDICYLVNDNNIEKCQTYEILNAVTLPTECA